MKQILLLLLFIPCLLTAQTDISIESEAGNDVVNFDDINLDDEWEELIDHGFLTNNGTQGVEIKWTYEVSDDAPAEWIFKLCDDSGCYPSSVSSTLDSAFDPLAVAAGESSLWDLHLNHKLVEGSALVTFNIYLASDTDNPIYTYVYNVTASAMVNTGDLEVEIKQLNAYPNPTKGLLNISNADLVDEVVVYNLLGRKVRVFDIKAGDQINLSDLQDGVYLVGMFSEEHGLLKTNRILKKNARP